MVRGLRKDAHPGDAARAGGDPAGCESRCRVKPFFSARRAATLRRFNEEIDIGLKRELQREKQYRDLAKASKGKNTDLAILLGDVPEFEFTHHPRYLKSLLRYRDLNGGQLPFDWSTPEAIDDALLDELWEYEYYLKYRKAFLKKGGDYG